MKTKKVDERLAQYRKEYETWLSELEKFVTARFDKNYKQYTAYTQTQGTETKISDPVAPEITERQINRLFERDPKFFVMAKGQNIPKEITEIIASVPAYYWTCPERVKSTGPMREKLKELGREFCVIGNAVMETFYNEESDTPDAQVKPVEDFIFNPIYTFKSSKIKFSRDFVDMDYIRKRVEITKDGVVTKGIFNAKGVKRVEEIYGESDMQDNPRTAKITRSGSSAVSDKEGPIELISRWDNNGHCCRFVKGIEEDEGIVLQEFDSILKEDPFDRAMDIKIVKQPYAFSMLDFLNGLTHLKDLFLNQMSDYGAKLLNPPLFYDPTSLGPVNKALLANAWKLAGLVPIAPNAAEHKPMPPLGSFSFDMLSYIQQRAESVSGIGAYLGGVPNQENDKTNGTASGISQMLEQAAGPLEDRRNNLEESIIEPMVNKWLKMAGFLMGQNETKYVLITGQDQKWVKVTKGLLTGKVTLNDLIEAELLTDEVDPETGLSQIEMAAQTMLAEGKDPEKDLFFDVDWVVKVEMGSTGQKDKKKEIDDFDSTIQAGLAMGVPIDGKKVWMEKMRMIGKKEPEQYLLQEDPNQMGMPGQEQPMIGSTPVQMPGMGMPPQMPM